MQRPVEIKTIAVTRTRARPSSRQLPKRGASRVRAARHVPSRKAKRTARAGTGIMACLLMAIVASAHFTDAVQRRPQQVRVVTGFRPQSWLKGTTLLTVYGRGFGTAPILGRLGMDHSFADVARQVRPYINAIHRNGPNRRVRIALHLIYGLATPCASDTTCLLYLDDAGVNIVKRYIKPAARRGWLVILDDQIGRSSPYSEIERMIARGYLRYDNVEVAFDPEFRSVAGQAMPGVPPGFVTARQLNLAERTLNRYCGTLKMKHRKLMLVHQWTSMMIQHRHKVARRLRYVSPVIVMDAIGAPADKIRAYDQLLGPGRAPGLWRGIKLFPPNPYEMAGHLDDPILSWRQVMGLGSAGDSYIRPVPSVIVMT